MPTSETLAYAPVLGFQSRKAEQIAAFFVARNGGEIEKLKLAKLQYLVEREFLRVHGRPVVYDELYSLPHGPICSASLNAIDGKLGADLGWVQVRSNGRNSVVGPTQVSRDELDEISDAELRVVEDVWARFGRKSAGQLRTWTHNPTNCPEYTEVGTGTRLPIRYAEVLNAVGQTRVEDLVSEITEFRHLEGMFKS
ncbi:MAG TPA: Panacea domain-containing protein [Caulobacteraceae bacterium]|jgi:uncharacterized phage-associated protein|nr:Panacea domain-containing protein [Caulobacteraceae bacterium]